MKLTEYLLELSLKEKGLEFYLERESGILYKCRDGLPFLEEAYDETSLTVRYLNTKGLSGITYTLSLDREGIKEAIERAKALSEYGRPTLFPPLLEEYPPLIPPSPTPMSQKEVMELLERGRKVCHYFKEIKRWEVESFSQVEREINLIREGKLLTWKCPEYDLFVSLVADSGAKQGTGYAYMEATSLAKINPEEIYLRASEKAIALSRGAKRASLKCAILFPPELALELLSLLSFSLKGDEVIKGRSYLKDKLSKKVFSEKITIIDDGLHTELPESRPFDDEGVAQKKTLLIREGVVESFIWDTYYGKLAETPSTGNSRRGDPSSPPGVDFTNLYLLPGTLSKEELLLSGGLVFEVLEVLGAHTADPISGEFSFGVSGILYEKGTPVDYLSEMALSGNIFEILREVELGSDLTFFGSLGAPSILLPPLPLG